MVEWREGYLTGGSTRFYARAIGHGPDLALLLHGWPETGEAWHRVAPAMAEAGWRVVCPDLKGFGDSDSPRRGYDTRTLADEISRLVRNLHVRKAVLVGHDWGGAVALATAFRHPGRVRHLVISNSPYRQLNLFDAWHVPLLNLPVLPEIAFRIVPGPLVRGAIRYAAHDPSSFPDDLVDSYISSTHSSRRGWLRYYRTLSRRAVLATGLEAIRRKVPLVDGRGGPARLRVPATVIWGEHDPVLDLELGRLAAEELGAELHVIAGAGHFPHVEAADEFAGAVLDAIGPASGEDRAALA